MRRETFEAENRLCEARGLPPRVAHGRAVSLARLLEQAPSREASEGLSWDRFLQVADPLFAFSPVQELKLWRVGPISPRLELQSPDLTAEGMRALAASPHLARLTRLSLSYTEIGDEGLRALAASPSLRNLTELSVRRSKVGTEGIRVLAASPPARTPLGSICCVGVHSGRVRPVTALGWPE